MSDADKPNEFKPLLRAYQNEIDALTKRMKYAESSFLQLFKALSEAPDPTPFLAGLAEAQSSLVAERMRGDALQGRVESMQGKVGTEEGTVQREQELTAMNADLQRQLAAATRRLAVIQSAHESSQETELPSSDRKLAAELDIAHADLDRCSAQLADAQAENARLRAISEDSDVAEYQRRLKELDEETARLFNALEKADAQASHQSAAHVAALSRAEIEALAKDEQLAQLRAELRRCADYDQITRDLAVLKSVEFSAWGDEQEEEEEDDDDDDDDDDGDGSLERLLVRRNKALENRLTDARNQVAKGQVDLLSVREQCQALETALDQKTGLAERLEADLLKVQNPPIENTVNEDPGGLLEIVTGQRDRFRQRNTELDDELRVQAASVGELRRQVEQMRQDNLRLYEEIKYLRSYTSTMSNTGHDSVSIPTPRNTQIDVGVGAKYRGMYEESLNPFSAFTRRETSRRVRSMGILDRLIYMFSNFVMGNRHARMVMLLYIALLHLLVVATLYRSMLQADNDSHERAPVPGGL
ncbi:hypothetical protein GGI20_002905 [Coemansia sp. BCRC 34301]|nr:hypothetical protein GGI20_002905 [Coemansia sp. BCRC 34301]